MERGAWQVADQSSLNGVWINGNRVNSHLLADRNLLTIGDYTLLFRVIRSDAAQRVRGRADEEKRQTTAANGGFPVNESSLESTADRVEEDLYKF